MRYYKRDTENRIFVYKKFFSVKFVILTVGQLWSGTNEYLRSFEIMWVLLGYGKAR